MTDDELKTIGDADDKASHGIAAIGLQYERAIALMGQFKPGSGERRALSILCDGMLSDIESLLHRQSMVEVLAIPEGEVVPENLGEEAQCEEEQLVLFWEGESAGMTELEAEVEIVDATQSQADYEGVSCARSGEGRLILSCSEEEAQELAVRAAILMQHGREAKNN